LLKIPFHIQDQLILLVDALDVTGFIVVIGGLYVFVYHGSCVVTGCLVVVVDDEINIL
jgi:hypothetical protein